MITEKDDDASVETVIYPCGYQILVAFHYLPVNGLNPEFF